MQIYHFDIIGGPVRDEAGIQVSACFAGRFTRRFICRFARRVELRPRMKCGAVRQKPVEVGRAVADSVRAGDEDLPALVNKGPCLGNSGGDAQANRRCGILASRGVYDEGHGKSFLRDAFIHVTLRRRPPATCVLAISIPAGSAIPVTTGHQENDREPASIDIPLRKSSSARFPARCAARCERKPPSHNLTPIGLRLRRISQYQQSPVFPVREMAT
jgi:hypothetical protein